MDARNLSRPANGTCDLGAFELQVAAAPTITSAISTTFTVGQAGTFTVISTGVPTATIATTSTLSNGVALTDNHDGTATLSGTPAAGSGGIYPLTLTAANGVVPNPSQSFTLTVNQAPTITSAAPPTGKLNVAYTYTISATGFPAGQFSLSSGTLPTGLTLAANGVLSGTPSALGSFTFIITVMNGVGQPVSQSYTIVITKNFSFLPFIRR